VLEFASAPFDKVQATPAPDGALHLAFHPTRTREANWTFQFRKKQ